MRIIFSFFILLAVSCSAIAQQRTCGMEAHMEQLLQDPDYQEQYHQKLVLMQQMGEHLEEARQGCDNPVILPVAIHFQGLTNPDVTCLTALAYNQIDILNNDIQGMNADISNWNNNASSFFPGADNGEACLEFCIATQNHPSGFGLQDGDPAITINQTTGSFASQWSGYVNIFVRNINALGFSPLGGNGNGDGITLDIQAFGSGAGCGQVSPNVPYHLGRTATHEIGHYLLLHHIWRNDGCGLDDLVSDTPLQDDEYFGCPNLGVSSCGSNDMHMSYMDYTNDPCMYMFSAGQVSRMENYVNTSLSIVVNNADAACGSTTPDPTCDDGIQNGNETGVDCGGPDCDPCSSCDDGVQNGQETGIDCGGPDCSPCVSCNDGIQNGAETGVDCGGPDCPPCVSCNDGIQNGQETGIDCGGPDCPDCPDICTENALTLTITLDALGQQTTWSIFDDNLNVVSSGGPFPNASPGTVITEDICLPDDCYTLVIYDSGNNGLCCRAGDGSYSLVLDANGQVLASGSVFGAFESTDFCLNDISGPSCNDGIQNGQETGVDCGGPDCAPCQTPTCFDGIQNGEETGVDCGGSDCPPCNTCTDGIQNGEETGVDCGGPDCAPCSTCDDGVQNGNETGPDCGGPDCPPCVSCNDGIQNGEETGVDCGGPDCDPCDTNPACDYPDNVTVTVYPNNPNRALFNWDPVPGATQYEIRIRVAGTSDWLLFATSNTSILILRLSAETEYEYQIRALCPDGWSTWAPIDTFMTPSGRLAASGEVMINSLYPNPAGQELNVDLVVNAEGTLQVEIVDVLGRIVSRQEREVSGGFETITMDISSLTSGFYHLKVYKDGLQVNEQFIKQ